MCVRERQTETQRQTPPNICEEWLGLPDYHHKELNFIWSEKNIIFAIFSLFCFGFFGLVKWVFLPGVPLKWGW